MYMNLLFDTKSMEYDRNRCCAHIIWRLCDIIREDAIKCDVKTREYYLQQAKGLHVGYFKYGGQGLLAEMDINKEYEHMRENIEMALDQALGPARQKSLTKLIITSSMKPVIEMPLKEAGLVYTAKYNNKSADVRVNIGGNRWLEVNLKYRNLNEAVDRLIAAAVAMKELCYMTGNNIGLPIL
jgi:hypothetical protein